MQKKQLGNSDMMITPIGVGAWAMGGGGWQFAWGPQDDNDSIAAIHAALDKGLNWIDTAAVYGLGHSEEIVGRALAGIPAADRPLIFTKCGLIWDPADRRAPARRNSNLKLKKGTRPRPAPKTVGRLPFESWSGRRVSNSRPQPWQGCALPTELLPR